VCLQCYWVGIAIFCPKKWGPLDVVVAADNEITAGQQNRHQVLAEPFLVSRAVAVVKPYVNWACEPLRPEDVPAAIVRGYHLAMQPLMGPVFISIPMDDWTHECRSVDVREVHPTVLADPVALDA
jgi:benzoylformate decarboxylase